MKSSKFLFYLGLVILVGCAGRGSKTSSKNSGYVPLSEAEAKIYTTPTIYYIPQFDLSQQTCEASSQKKLKDSEGLVLFSVCSSIYDACLMQGTCEIIFRKERALVNVSGRVNSDYRFKKVINKTCSFGFGGGKEICLDPYHSIAADLSIYKLGQVIYIPTAVGLALPDGTRHDGYFVVRDSGGNIKGYGRFDFFTGFLGNHKQSNPFAQIGFSDKETHVQYYVLSEQESAEILKKRNYPKLPVSK